MMVVRQVVVCGWLVLAVAAVGHGKPQRRPDESCFVRKATWLETVIASHEGLLRRDGDLDRAEAEARGTDPSLKLFEAVSVEMTAQDPVRHVRVRVTGLERIYIGARGQGFAFFGDPQIVWRDRKASPLSIRCGERHGGTWNHDERPQEWQPIKSGAKIFAKGFTCRDGELCIGIRGQEEWIDLHIGALESRDRRPVQIWIDRVSHYAPSDKPGRAQETIWRMIADAFPQQIYDRQQRLEQQARIWATPWKPGDYAELARRYAAACAPEQRKAAQELATRCNSLAGLQRVRDLFYVQHIRARLDLAGKTLAFVERAASRPQLAAELQSLRQRIANIETGNASGEALYAAACDLRRRIILSHPALDFPKLLINKRSGSLPEHMCDQYLGRHSQVAPGLVVLDNWKDRPAETVLLAGKLPKGGLIHPDLSYDGRRVLFAFADHQSPRQGQLRGYFIHEYDFDTGKVRQITGTPADSLEGQKLRQTVLTEDMDPCYLPDGGMAFISTRSQQYGRCHGGRYVPSYTLYRGELDGSHIRPLSFNESNEWGPSVLHDGSIVYTRWDYVNRHDVIFQSLWVIRPDGTQTAHYYGNNSRAPCLTGEAQAIPNSHKSVSTAAAHHGQTLGTIIVVDPAKGQDHGSPLTWITPELGFPESPVPDGIATASMPLPDDLPNAAAARRSPRAATPWPLSEDLFLCTYQHGEKYAIYLVDTLGGRELIHADAATSCFDPIPLRPRPTPPSLPSAIAGREIDKTGVFYIQDVYQSRTPFPRGSIKSMRINEIISQTTNRVPQRSHAANEIVKKVLGTVPVADDGSVALEAPANTPMQFQLLDENGMAIMTMRSLVYLQPGERASCTGCHEPRNTAPPISRMATMAIQKIRPPVGPRYDGGFRFARTVQPVLDRHCIACHGLDKAEKGIDLTGAMESVEVAKSKKRHASAEFSVAYNSLISGGMVKVAPRNGETYPSQPKDYFAHAGKLAAMLLAGHPDKSGTPRVRLDRDSLQRIIDWLDLNAQFYGDYSFNRAENQPPLPEGEKALRAAIEKRFGREIAAQPYAALVNVANPGESRILLAPLPVQAGGWAQITTNAFTGTSDLAYQEMRRLVDASITPLRFHDIAGTCGRDNGCACGTCWVRQDRATRRPPATTAQR